MVAYRQPDSDQYALGGYSFMRINQELASPGDIFESAQGAHAFAIGPQSDISRINIGYFDRQVPNTFLNKFTLTPQRVFESSLTAFNKTAFYSPSKVPGRLLIWPEEIYDSTYLPPGFDPVDDGLIREIPAIDVIQFFSPPSSLSGVRSDKTYYYDDLPWMAGAAKIVYILIPYFGRRYASISISNNTSGATFQSMNASISGVNFRQSETAPKLVPLLDLNSNENGNIIGHRSVAIGTGYDLITQPTREVTNNAASVADANISYNAGLFDYLLIEVDGDPTTAGHTPLASVKVTVSDVVGRGPL